MLKVISEHYNGNIIQTHLTSNITTLGTYIYDIHILSFI